MSKDLTPYTNAMGLVPVVINISEAGLGLIKGEIRGVPPEIAATMLEKKHCTLVPLEEIKAAQIASASAEKSAEKGAEKSKGKSDSSSA